MHKFPLGNTLRTGEGGSLLPSAWGSVHALGLPLPPWARAKQQEWRAVFITAGEGPPYALSLRLCCDYIAVVLLRINYICKAFV